MTGGPGRSERREQSESFSLQELMKLEDERIRDEQQARAARERAATDEREEAARKQRELHERNERAAAEAKDRAQRAELDDVARREAMQKATVEQARLEVEVRARSEERELERRHELELQRLRQDGKSAHVGSLAAATLIGGVTMLFVALAIHFGAVKPANEGRVAELERKVRDEGAAAEDLSRQLAEQKRKTDALEKVVRHREGELDELRSRVELPKSLSSSPRHRATTPERPASTTGPSSPICVKGDPMCPTIPH